MTKYTIYIIFCGIMIWSSGCETLSQQKHRQRDTRLHNDIANLKASVERLEQRLDGIEAGREDVYAQISGSRASRAKSEAQHRAEIEALENKLAAQRAAQERMRKEMVAELSTKMEGIIKTQGIGASVSGVEHRVEAGQTLSEIAKAYGVKSKAIIKANRLKNPDDLRIGQLLIIPD
jgi:LysM repeat protein